MAVSRKWGVLFVGVLIKGALLVGVYSRAPDFWKPPQGLQNAPKPIHLGSYFKALMEPIQSYADA